MKILWESKIKEVKIQADLFERGALLVLLKVVLGHGVGSVDTSELEMPHDGDGIKTSIGLSFESIHEAVQIDGKVVPTTLLPVRVGTLDKEWFYFKLVVGGGYHDSSFSLF